MSDTNKTKGFDDFDMELDDIPTLAPINKDEINRDGMRAIQKEHGFDRPAIEPSKGWEGKGAPKEPIRALQFRMPESEVLDFHQDALDEFGNAHGGKVALFRKMRELYKASKAS